MQVSLQEFCDSRGTTLRVDPAAGIIRGVKVLGLESRNGRTYRPACLAAAVPLYEGAKVNVNHPKGHPLSARDYQDRIGVLRGVVQHDDDGLFADFHFNPQHALAAQLTWDAQHAPENVGFSHNVLARLSHDGPRQVVEEITHVQSVDLVADPATTRGLFEARQPAEAAWETLTADALKQARPDLVQALLAEAAGASLTEPLPDRAARRQALGQLLREFRLPDPERDGAFAATAVDAAFLAALEQAADESARRRLAAARAAQLDALLAWALEHRAVAPRPQSREQRLAEQLSTAAVCDGQTFARAIALPGVW